MQKHGHVADPRDEDVQEDDSSTIRGEFMWNSSEEAHSDPESLEDHDGEFMLLLGKGERPTVRRSERVAFGVGYQRFTRNNSSMMTRSAERVNAVLFSKK